MDRGPTISQEAYQLLESTFNLHAATIPSLFSSHGGSGQSMALLTVVEVFRPYPSSQRRRKKSRLPTIFCPLLTRPTTAFLYGGSATLYRPETDEVLGWQLEQIKSLLKSSHRSWDHPLLLPAILLRTHSERVEIQANNLERDLIALENGLSRIGHLTDEINSSESRSEILYSMSLIEGLLGALETTRE
jgi:hypothetical protein